MTQTRTRSIRRLLLPLALAAGVVASPLGAAPSAGAQVNQIMIWNATDSQESGAYWEPPLNQPANYLTPIDYANGRAHIKIRVDAKPSTRSMKAIICFWRHGTSRFQFETCKAGPTFTKTGTYYADLGVPMSWWDKNGYYDWRKPASVGRIMLVDPATGKILMNNLCGNTCYKGVDISAHIPVKMTSQLVFVKKGAAFAPPAGW